MSRARALSLVLSLVAAVGCGGAPGGEVAFPARNREDDRAAGPAIRMSWARDLTPRVGGLYRPVERSAPAIDATSARIYVGTTERYTYAFSAAGERLYRYATESGVEAEPTVDAKHDELYVGTSRGVVHALRASDGSVRWKAELHAAISRAAVLSDDAVYVVTDEDSVFALSRADGSMLWRHKREPRAGLQIAGHAGLRLAGQRLLTGFTDGTVAALSASDGRVRWSVDTTLDFADPAAAEKGFVDVDTTPVEVDGVVYAASFLGGFYAIDAADGAVRAHDAELTQITSLAATDDALIVGSAKHGVVCLELPSLAPRWVYSVRRGAPGTVTATRGTVYVTETRGALLALRLRDGTESGRLQTEHGFTTTPSLHEGRGFILGNAGTLYAFEY